MKRAILLFFVIIYTLSCLICLPACSFGDEDTDVAVFYYSKDDAYLSSVRTDMDIAFNNLKLSYRNYDADSNQAKQNEQIDKAIKKGARAIVVNIADAGSDSAASAIVKRAKEADIPLIFFNRAVSEEIVKSYEKCALVATDYEMAGKMQGELIGAYLTESFDKVDINKDGKISYVLFKGPSGNPEAEARSKYSLQYANAALEENGLNKLHFYDDSNENGYISDDSEGWSDDGVTKSMRKILSTYSEANGNMVELIIANNDQMAIGALNAIYEKGYNKAGGRTIPIFGIDATEAAQEKIENGAITGTVRQDSETMADTIAQIVKNSIEGANKFTGIDKNIIKDNWKINIPYSAYMGEDD